MATERDFVPPTPVSYNVGGNTFRAYFDNAHNLLFVVDDTITADKPNVMLILSPVPGRKWDDILAREYGVDLETIRPRRDNKYQKLDIEYSGLDVYRELARVADTGDDWTAALGRLARFRIDASRRAATERLNAATDTAAKSRETIVRTGEVITDLQTRLRELRAKLKRQRNMIGREPTKQSASKILRIEAQIDTTNEKLTRAKKRLLSAQRRLAAAEKDAEIAREILNRGDDAVHVAYDAANIPVGTADMARTMDAATDNTDDVDDDADTEYDYVAPDADNDIEYEEDETVTTDLNETPAEQNAPVFANITDMPHFTTMSFDDDADEPDEDEEHEKDAEEEYIERATDEAAANIAFAPVSAPADTDKIPVDMPELVAPTHTGRFTTQTEPRTEEMADEKEVKPLFDKDPEILDEEIAFKPIDFDVRAAGASAPRATTPVRDAEESVAPSPLSFVPPTGAAPARPQANTWENDIAPATPSAPFEPIPVQTQPVPEPAPQPAPREIAPVIDTFTTIETTPTGDTMVSETFAPAPDYSQSTPAPVNNYYTPDPQPARPASPIAAAPAATSMPDVAAAPMGSSFRPTSPIKNDRHTAPVDPAAKKPNLLYYLLLILLIVLSIFTLWFYQKSTRDGTPDLAGDAARRIEQAMANAETEPAETPTESVVEEVTIIEEAPIVPEPEPIPEPEPEPVFEPVAVVPMPEPEPEPVPVIPAAPVAEDSISPFIQTATYEAPKPQIPSEEEVLARKPAYNVSQQEKMFVADDNYVSETTVATTPAANDYVVEEYYDDTIDYDSDVAPMPAYDHVPQEVTSQVFTTTTTTPAAPTMPDVADDEEITCAGGSMPDMYGCCPGEEYADIDGMGMCCVGDECFPPM